MPTEEVQPEPDHEAVIGRFVTACEADPRVVAAFLGGSLARGTADAYSDLDLYLVTTNAAYDDFYAGRAAFLRRLGEPVFLKDYDAYGFHLLLFMLADGTEGELGLGRAGHFRHIHSGPHKVLLDKQGLLAGSGFPARAVDRAAQRETLQDQILWFWHDLSHFITALGRGQVWAAYGALEDLRRACVNLLRLRHNFAAPADGYEKVEGALPVSHLAPLAATVCPLEPDAMLAAVRRLIPIYQVLAPALAALHGLPYPGGAEAVVLARLARLEQARAAPDAPTIDDGRQTTDNNSA